MVKGVWIVILEGICLNGRETRIVNEAFSEFMWLRTNTSREEFLAASIGPRGLELLIGDVVYSARDGVNAYYPDEEDGVANLASQDLYVCLRKIMAEHTRHWDNR